MPSRSHLRNAAIRRSSLCSGDNRSNVDLALVPGGKRFLNHILKGIIAGHCDLDILLDPLFLHYPRPHEDRIWYPGLGQSTDPNSLIDALEIADRNEPWRNQFRNSPDPHPAMAISRLHGKFLPAP